MSYRKGDRFIIEIEQVQEKEHYHDWREPSVSNIYHIKGFNTLVFDDYGLDKLTKIPEDAEIVTLEEIFWAEEKDNIILNEYKIADFGDGGVLYFNPITNDMRLERVFVTGEDENDTSVEYGRA